MTCQLINGDKLIYFSLVNLVETTDDIVSLDWLQISNNSEQAKKFPNYWYEDITIFGPRNGIYCLHEHTRAGEDVLALVNFSLRELKLIPKREESIFWHTGFQSQVFVEIGFDPKTNDYKVFLFKICDHVKEGERQTAIYHASSNSWRKLSDPLLDHLEPYAHVDCDPDACVNGNVHWLAYVDNHKYCDWYILCFDMVAEVFARIEPPPDLRIHREAATYAVAAYNGSLSIIHAWKPEYYPERRYTSFHIWVMKDYGNYRSWTKEFTTLPIHDAFKLVDLWRNGEFLIRDENDYTISYDPSAHKMERLICFGDQLLLHCVWILKF